jgi:putative transposase
VSFIDQHRERFGVEPICDVLQVAPSTYYAAVKRPPSSRRLEDEKLSVELRRVYDENQEVYGAEKLWTQMNREGIEVGRDRVARLMRAQGLAGEVRGNVWRTTVPSESGPRPADLVDRKFEAAAPNRLWVADLTYVSTWAGSPTPRS